MLVIYAKSNVPAKPCWRLMLMGRVTASAGHKRRKGRSRDSGVNFARLRRRMREGLRTIKEGKNI